MSLRVSKLGELMLSIESGPPYQNLKASEAIVPRLPIAVQSSTTVNLDILSAPHPEGDRVLERIKEVVRLPIFDIVGELQTTRSLASL